MRYLPPRNITYRENFMVLDPSSLMDSNSCVMQSMLQIITSVEESISDCTCVCSCTGDLPDESSNVIIDNPDIIVEDSLPYNQVSYRRFANNRPTTNLRRASFKNENNYSSC